MSTRTCDARREVCVLQLKAHFPTFLRMSSRDTRDWVCFLLGLGSFSIFLPVVWFDFTNYDDPGYVVHNLHVVTGLSLKNLGWAFSSLHAGLSYWHPITWLSHQLDCQLFGVRAGAHHTTSALLHSIGGVLLFLFLNRTTGRLGRSAMVAALFCIHPLHVESVAWVAERKDVLSGVFWMATLCAYSSYAEKTTIKRYGLVFLFFVLGLMSKPSTVALPCTLLLVDYWPLGRFREPPAAAAGRSYASALKLLAEKVPLFASAAAASVATFEAQRQLGAMSSIDALPLSDRIDNAIVSYGLYILKTFWPSRLAVIYVHPGSWPFSLVLLVGGFLSCVSYLVWRYRRPLPYLIVGWLWFLGTLVPMIGLVQVGAQSMADRYTYISLIGLFIIIVWGVADLAGRFHVHNQIVIGSAVGIFLAATVTMHNQLLYWRDAASLFEHAVEVTHNNWLAHHNYGLCLANLKRYSEADSQFLTALRISPRNSMVNRSRGALYLEKGDWCRASELLMKSLEVDPKNANANRELALICASAPEDHLRNGQLALSYAFAAYAATKEPDAAAFEALAAGFAECGEFATAVEAEEYACSLAVANGQDEREFQRRVAVYRSGQPLRTPKSDRLR